MTLAQLHTVAHCAFDLEGTPASEVGVSGATSSSVANANANAQLMARRVVTVRSVTLFPRRHGAACWLRSLASGTVAAARSHCVSVSLRKPHALQTLTHICSPRMSQEGLGRKRGHMCSYAQTIPPSVHRSAVMAEQTRLLKQAPSLF